MSVDTIMSVVPPFQFSPVEEGVYRGAYPNIRNFRFLRRLSLKTIVSLIPEPPNVDLMEFCQLENIEHHHIEAEKYVETANLSHVAVAKVLKIITCPKNFPVYLHCLDGGNITGYVIMGLRKLQNVALHFIYSEFCRFSTDSLITQDDISFLDHFREEIKITEIPSWLWCGEKISKHPTLKIIYKENKESKPEIANNTLPTTPIKHDVSSMSFPSRKRLPWKSKVRSSIFYSDLVLPMLDQVKAATDVAVDKSLQALIL